MEHISSAKSSYGVFALGAEPVLEAIQREDAFGMVIRTTAMLETALNQAFVAWLAIDPKDFEGVRIEWASLARLCIAMKMVRSELLLPLLEYGRLRNRFAHTHGYEFNETDLAKLMSAVHEAKIIDTKNPASLEERADISSNIGKYIELLHNSRGQ
ncbi:MAG TPA: hypothetical protein VN905_11345 [Candidatus Binatia bacterium]|nr:hypothetical protein [Candidatus Binatia bacterium]